MVFKKVGFPFKKILSFENCVFLLEEHVFVSKHGFL